MMIPPCSDLPTNEEQSDIETKDDLLPVQLEPFFQTPRVYKMQGEE